MVPKTEAQPDASKFVGYFKPLLMEWMNDAC
jgi:hypothetical protein